MPFKIITLNDGRVIPQIAFETWRVPQPKTADNIEAAFEVGFEHVDTAQSYGNEEQVVQALKESGLNRSEKRVTTKWSGREGMRPHQAIASSLAKLGLSYVDLYLIHHPSLLDGDILGGWEEMEQIQKAGLAKSIGVCNFESEDLEKLASAHIVPAVNQIMLHPYVYKDSVPLIAYCQKKGIAIEGYSTLIPLLIYPDGPVSKTVTGIAKRLNVKEEQVLLAWVKAKTVVIVTTSSKKDRLIGYQAVGDIELSEDEITAIDEAGSRGVRSVRRRFAMKILAAGLAFQLATFAAYKYWMRS